jgi:predicted permease
MSTMTTAPAMWEELYTTFLASVRSVGTACTLAGVGIYLHQRGYVVGNGKRTLALISQQVTIPLLFFTKILYCNQDWSAKPCPNVTESLREVWVLLVWPLYVCATGMFVGWGCAKLAGVPSKQIPSLLVAVGFGNSTGLPITLLNVIHSNFPVDSGLGRIDPTLFLTVYLLLYPVLQWGVGGWLLAPPEKKDGLELSNRSIDNHKKDDDDDGGGGGADGDVPNSTAALTQSDSSDSRKHNRRNSSGLSAALTRSHGHGPALAHNVLNRSDRMPEQYQIEHRGISEVDASFYMSIQENLNRWGEPVIGRVGSYAVSPTGKSMLTAATEETGEEKADEDDEELGKGSGGSVGMDLSGMDISSDSSDKALSNGLTDSVVQNNGATGSNNGVSSSHTDEQIFRAMKTNDNGGKVQDSHDDVLSTEISALLPKISKDSGKNVLIVTPTENDADEDCNYEDEHCFVTLMKVIQRCLQPPVIGALLGLLIASFPKLRSIFVDIYDRNGDAPLQWFFDGLYATGEAAVPINMMILGCNLSASYMLNANDVEHRSKFFSTKASMLAVVGKMVRSGC